MRGGVGLLGHHVRRLLLMERRRHNGRPHRRLRDRLRGSLRLLRRRPHLRDVEERREALLVEAAGVVGRQVARRPWVHVVGVAATLADRAGLPVSAALQVQRD